jgi:hypothetical protein
MANFNNDSTGVNLFGFNITKSKNKDVETKSFVPAVDIEGGIEVGTGSGAGFNSYSIDLDPSSIKNEIELISKYREISLVSDIDIAISEIIDEFMVIDETEELLTIDFDVKFDEKYSKKTKEAITEEFKNILDLLKFQSIGPDIARNWYIDGRLAFHKIVDREKSKEGIKELRPIDVAKLKRIIEIKKEVDPKTGISLVAGQSDYYIYSDTQKNANGTQGDQKTGIKIAPESIAYITSGLIDRNSNMSLSYLHKAIRPLNQLRMMEDSDVIYRLTRAPQRRIFYIDTSGMARTKAEQYIKDVMARYKNKQVYDVNTGTVKDAKNHQSILEDFFLPRTTGGKGTEITTLDGAPSLGSIENTQYFQQKLYQSLNIPMTRLQQGQGSFNIGRSNEITRDEIKFAKFINKLRLRFNNLFFDLLKTQLLLKGIATPEDWILIKENLRFRYAKDNFFAELKESDMLRERLQNVQIADMYVGKYYSREYVMRNMLKLTDEEVDDMNEQMDKESAEAAKLAASQPEFDQTNPAPAAKTAPQQQ